MCPEERCFAYRGLGLAVLRSDQHVNPAFAYYLADFRVFFNPMNSHFTKPISKTKKRLITKYNSQCSEAPLGYYVYG